MQREHNIVIQEWVYFAYYNYISIYCAQLNILEVQTIKPAMETDPFAHPPETDPTDCRAVLVLPQVLTVRTSAVISPDGNLTSRPLSRELLVVYNTPST